MGGPCSRNSKWATSTRELYSYDRRRRAEYIGSLVHGNMSPPVINAAMKSNRQRRKERKARP